MNKITAAEYLVRELKRLGTTTLHQYPGGTIAPILEACRTNQIRIFTSRHEQGAGYAALAESRIKHTPGIVAVTSGPGVTNVMTAVADAYYDSLPMIIITGQVGTSDLSRSKTLRQRGFQEVNTPDLFAPITKAQFQPKSIEEIETLVQKAWDIAVSGRPGPVSLDLPMDIQRSLVDEFPSPSLKTSVVYSNKVPYQPDSQMLSDLIEAMSMAKKPVIICGNGMANTPNAESLRDILALWPCPVSHSLPGLGCIDSNSELSLGYHGHTGSHLAGEAIHESDLLIVLGSRLDIRQTGSERGQFAPHARLFRVEMDEAEIAHSVFYDREIVIQSNLSDFLPDWLNAIRHARPLSPAPWVKGLAERKKQLVWPYKQAAACSPEHIVSQLSSMATEPVCCVTGVGAHQHWAARHFRLRLPERRLFTSAGHGAMGYDLPTAIGAALHQPEATVLCFVGDGSIQMNIQELATLNELSLNVKVVVFDNERLALVSQFQLFNWDKDTGCGDKDSPDFKQIAEAYGLTAFEVDTDATFDEVAEQFINSKGPALLHVKVDPKQDVLPMLLAGQTMDKMWPYFNSDGSSRQDENDE